MKAPAPPQRYPEIDLLRTAAIVMMVLYHLAYDLRFFHGFMGIDPFKGGWWLLARTTASLFILLTGISFMLSREKMLRRHTSTKTMARRWLWRFLVLLASAMLVTIVTYFFDRTLYVRYGILHMIATSVLLLPLFAPLRQWNVLLGIALIAAGWFMRMLPWPNEWLLPLGILPPVFASMDYFPLLPWLGVTLIGAGIGHAFYIGESRLRRTYDAWRLHIDARFKKSAILRALTIPGKYSLWIYLIHQPVLIGLLRAIFA